MQPIFSGLMSLFSTNIRPAARLALPVCLVLILCACTAAERRGYGIVPDGITHDFGSKTTLYEKSTVSRPERPFVDLAPENSPDRELTAVVLPFRVVQETDWSRHLGREISSIFWRTWLAQKQFRILEYLEGYDWIGGMDAVSKARFLGADLAIGGEITHFMAGGTTGRSELSVRIYAYDAQSASLVWSITHAGAMDPGVIDDNILYWKKKRMPADPMYAVARQLAADIGQEFIRWRNPEGGKPHEESLFGESETIPVNEQGQSSTENTTLF